MLWQAEDTIIRLSLSADTVKFWDKILCIGWFAMAPLAFHFSCKLADLKELTSRFAIFMIYGPFAVLYALYIADSNNTTFLRDETWGWINLPRVGTFDAFHRYWITLMVIATLFVLLRYAYETRKNKEKKYQAWIIAAGIL